MADHYDASPPPNLRPRRPDHLSPGHRDASGRKSDETGESSRGGSLVNDNSFSRETTMTPRSSDDAPLHAEPSNHHARRDTKAPHRSHRPRGNGAFLLSDTLLDDAAPDVRQTGAPARRSQNGAAGGARIKTAAASASTHTQGTPRTPKRSHAGQNNGDGALHTGNGSAERHLIIGDREVAGGGVTAGSTTSSPARQSTAMAPLDVDAAQIVNMALNLSESRRLAAKRNVSQPLPPRLIPLPDSTVGGSLRQQLQQQRRLSRTVSPKPDRGGMQRAGSSGHRMSSPLQTAFDASHDGTFRYHFSQSTIARAQKAKDHLELLAQYRRLLELVPPLIPPAALRKGSTISVPASPSHSAPMTPNVNNVSLVSELGRPYNPLQYIRNRKVRARGRLTIDGESQGFGDVVKVTDWVDEVAKWVATGQNRLPGNSALPPFASANEAIAESSPPSNASRPSVSMSKSKRPRVDWVIDPADMLADVYWLEQDSNKLLIEDRHWRRIYPQDPDLYRPLSQQTEGGVVGAATSPFRANDKVDAGALPDAGAIEKKASKTGSEHVLSSAKEKAKQKLHSMRSSHRHTGSVHSRRGSGSESSDSDSDRRLRSRSGTFGGSGKDILEKQMMEMIAREAKEDELTQMFGSDTQRSKSRSQSIMTPERTGRDSAVPSRQHSRRESRAELSDPGRSVQGSPHRSGRASLEVPPPRRRSSVDDDTSPAISPDLRPSRTEGSFIPTIGMDLSPESSRPASPRPGSPSRNPFSKVKNIFRERSRERAVEAPLTDKEDNAEPAANSLDRVSSSPESGLDKKITLDRISSVSPGRKVASRGTSRGHGSHRHMGGVRIGRDEPGAGLRSLFKGPRIDSVLRSGVSKVSELLWRRESDDHDVDSSSTSSDESEGEDRGRRRDSDDPTSSPQGQAGQIKRPSKHFLDVMPPFVHASESQERAASEHPSMLGPALSRPSSRRSSRFDLLKPPKIDVQSASAPPSPPPESRKTRDEETTDSESRRESRSDGVRVADARLNAVLGLPQSFTTPLSRQFSGPSRGGDAGRAPETGLAPVSRREIARMRSLMLSTGIMAMEISRRVNEPRLLVSSTATDKGMSGMQGNSSLSWAEIAKFSLADERELVSRPICQAELFPLSARVLSSAIQHSAQEWHATADALASQEMSGLQRRIDGLRGKVALDLTSMTRSAADEADEVSRDLIVGQRLKVKRVVDIIEKMLRRKRRRFRWVRRAGWLAVEWVLVGFMWYVWFVVMIARIFLGMGRGVVAGVRWLLWL